MKELKVFERVEVFEKKDSDNTSMYEIRTNEIGSTQFRTFDDEYDIGLLLNSINGVAAITMVAFPKVNPFTDYESAVFFIREGVSYSFSCSKFDFKIEFGRNLSEVRKYTVTYEPKQSKGD